MNLQNTIGYNQCLSDLLQYLEDKTQFKAQYNNIKASDVLDDFISPKIKECEQNFNKFNQQPETHPAT